MYVYKNIMTYVYTYIYIYIYIYSQEQDKLDLRKMRRLRQPTVEHIA